MGQPGAASGCLGCHRRRTSQDFRRFYGTAPNPHTKTALKQGRKVLTRFRRPQAPDPHGIRSRPSALHLYGMAVKENLKTARAWLHKENFGGFWEQESGWAAE